MKKVTLSLTAAMVLAAGMSGIASADTLENIITNPKVSLEIRPRYEYADVKDNGKDSAKALTVRTRLGLTANLFDVEGLGAQIEMTNVANFGWVDEYFPEQPGYDTIMDPSQTRVTQANVSYSANGFTGIVGRKMVVLDNARFIGNVGWRQMPQTYDLAAVIYNGIENLSLLGAYVNRVHTVKKDGVLDTSSVLLHGSYKAMPELTITVYDYMIQNFADHIGIRLTGKVAFDEVKLNYTAEYAVQNDPSLTDEDDHHKNPLPFVDKVKDPDDIEQDADYYNLNVGLNYAGFIAGVGYEVLSDKGDGNAPFWTPLATLHAMNGWADVFLKTPPQGLEDFTVKLGYNFGEYGKIIGIYHDFQSDKKNTAGDDDLGNEIDLAYKYKINKNLGLLLKYANYSGADKTFLNGKGKPAYPDTTKYWVQLDYKFNAEM